ncbi:hypothetical protein KM043_009865 [Ampulex compressa]|nr:hypothetical protein KM043_009865 [Ampulex compressa]
MNEEVTQCNVAARQNLAPRMYRHPPFRPCRVPLGPSARNHSPLRKNEGGRGNKKSRRESGEKKQVALKRAVMRGGIDGPRLGGASPFIVSGSTPCKGRLL